MHDKANAEPSAQRQRLGTGGSPNNGLTQQDWGDICEGGALCNPGDGLPNFDDGGGLSLTFEVDDRCGTCQDGGHYVGLRC